MNFKKFLTIFMVVTIAFLVVGCKKTDDTTSKFNPVAIETILKDYKNNYVVDLEGVVYGIVENGFYVSDSAVGKVFVVMGNTWNKKVAIGDKVQITGVFSIVNNQIQIKSVSNLVIASSGNATLEAAASTIKDVSLLDSTVRTGSLAQYYTITGTIDKSLAGYYTIYDDEGNTLLFNENSNTSLLEASLNKRVSLPIIVHSFSVTEHKWIVSFCGKAEDISSAALTFEEVLEKAQSDLANQVPTDVYGALELPKGHNVIGYINYSWDVVANDYLTINEDGKVIIVISEEDHNVNLKVTVSDGERNETIDYPVVLKGIVEQSLGNMLSNVPPVNYSVVKVNAIVVSIIRNQSLDIRSLIVMDLTTKDTITVDIFKTGTINQASEAFTNVKVGDEIVTTAEYRHSDNDRPTLMNVRELMVKSSGNVFEHDFANAYVLNDKESYDNFAENLYKHINKLVKIENPYMNYSTTSKPSETNWVRLGWSEVSGNAQHGVKSKYYFSLLIAANNETLGTPMWHEMFDIPFLNDPAKQFGTTIYAYPVYISGIVQFIIPDLDCYQLSKVDSIKLTLASELPNSIEMGEIDLVTNHEMLDADTAITWTSSHPAIINPSNGVVNPTTENTDVTLTASFIVDGTEKTLDFIVSVLKVTPLTIAELYAEAVDNKNVKVQGVVVGYVSDGNDVESRKGLIVLDKTSGDILLVNGFINININNSYPNYKTNDGTAIVIGDEIVFTGIYYENSVAIGSGPVQTGRRYVYLTATSVLTIQNSNVDYNFNPEKMIVIDSNEDLTNLAADIKYGTVIKFVGTMENPIYVGSSASKLPSNFKICMYDAVDNNGTKYNGQTFAIKSDVNEAIAGSQWYKDWFGYDTIYVAPNTTNKMNQVVGEMYCVVTYRTSTYFQMTFVNVENTTVTLKPTKELIDGELTKELPATVEIGDLEFTLPTTNKNVTGNIVWTSSDSNVIDLSSMKALNVTENTEVTLTGTYTFLGNEYNAEYKIIVLAAVAAPAVTVTEALASTDASLLAVHGVIAGYHKDTDSNCGLILMDNVNGKMLLVHGLAGTYGNYKDKDGNVLVIGDEIEITSAIFTTTSSIEYAGVETQNRKMLAVTVSSEVTRKSQNNTLNFDYEHAIVIDSTEDLQSFADNPQYAVLIKISSTVDAPLYMGNNSTSGIKNLRIHFNGAATKADDIKVNGFYFSCQATYNEANVGENWYNNNFGTVTATAKVIQKTCTGDLYVVLTYSSTIYQLSVMPVGALNTLAEKSN